MASIESNDEVLQVLRRNNELLTLIAKAALAPILEKEIAEPKHRQLYELTGNETVSAIAKKLGMGAGTISGLWQRWEEIGLLVKDGKRYRRTLG